MSRLILLVFACFLQNFKHFSHFYTLFYQYRPIIFPSSSMSVISAAGTFGSSGILMTVAVRETIKSVPALRITSRIVSDSFPDGLIFSRHQKEMTVFYLYDILP